MTARVDLQELLYRALGEPVGLLVATAEPAKARQLLYATRREIGDPALGRLQFRMVELDGGSIAIVKGAVLPPPPAYQPLPGQTSPDLGDLDL